MWADQAVRDWIDDVCRQYSRSIGRALTFEPYHDRATAAARNTVDAGECWRTSITDGTQTIGVLKLRCRAGRQRDAEFLKACETAELAAHLIERVIVACGAEDHGPREPENRRLASCDSGHTTAAASSLQRTTDPSAPNPGVERRLDALRRMTGFPAAALFVRDADNGGARLCAFRSAQTFELSLDGLAPHAAAFECDGDGEQIAIYRRSISPRSPIAVLPLEISTGVVCQIGKPDGPKAALWMFDRRDRQLTHRDRHAIGLVADRLEPLIMQAALLDECSNSRTLNAELRVASRTQSIAPIHYRGPGGWCELAACTRNARSIGGDLLEVIPLANDRVLVAVGDAAGHSIPAAIVMASARGALRAVANETLANDGFRGGQPAGLLPEEVLGCVNSVLHSIVQAQQFMTIFCGILDGSNRTFAYANAGHPPPLLVRDGQIEHLTCHGLVLGVTPDANYQGTTLSLEGGDVLVFYTDGVTEACDRERGLFGSHGVEDTILRHLGRSADEMRDEVWSALQNHIAGSSRHDDRTLAVLRIAD